MILTRLRQRRPGRNVKCFETSKIKRHETFGLKFPQSGFPYGFPTREAILRLGPNLRRVPSIKWKALEVAWLRCLRSSVIRHDYVFISIPNSLLSIATFIPMTYWLNVQRTGHHGAPPTRLRHQYIIIINGNVISSDNGSISQPFIIIIIGSEHSKANCIRNLHPGSYSLRSWQLSSIHVTRPSHIIVASL